MDITTLTSLINTFRAETKQDSITPDSLGLLLQRIVNVLGHYVKYPSQLITDGYVLYLLRYSKKRPRYRPAEMRTRRTKRARLGSPAGGARLSHQSKRPCPSANFLPPFRTKTPTGWRKSSNGLEKTLQRVGENPPPRWSDTFNGVQDFILSFPSVFPLP